MSQLKNNISLTQPLSATTTSSNATLGAVLLVAGTCIGSGMIALPLVLAKLGLVPSLLLMLGMWFVMYYTSLVNIELNLQADKALPLGGLGRYFSGRIAELIGTLSLKVLSYSLLAVYIYGGSSIVQQLLASKMAMAYSFEGVASCFSLGTMIILLFPIKYIDYFNRILFLGLLVVVTILIVGLALSITWTHIPLFSDQYTDLSAWLTLIPVVFTSFGFQVIFHTLTNYCRKNPNMLKQAFLWGSFIPAIVYIFWTATILSVVYHENPGFYSTIMQGKAEIGDLIQVLSSIAKWPSVQLLIWAISLLAIVTSIVGVGMGLFDAVKEMLPRSLSKNKHRDIVTSVAVVGPAYLAVLYIPNAFITVLGFAGMILAIIAIVLPTYLFWKLQTSHLYYNELKENWLIQLSFFVGITVIACEIYTMLL